MGAGAQAVFGETGCGGVLVPAAAGECGSEYQRSRFYLTEILRCSW